MRWELVVWASLSLLLIAAEAFVPGAFLLWLGLAAAAVFAICALVPGLGVLAQVCAFVLLAFVAIAIYRRWFSRAGVASDQPLLNRRADQLVGQTALLVRPIRDGHGQVQIGDTLWLVSGVDQAAGTRVRVVAVEGMVLKVQPA